MKIRKFVAADVQEAVAQVKRELGAEAMIIATRHVRRGLLGQAVEVTAALDVDEEPSLAALEERRSAPAQAPRSALSDADVERLMLPLRSELRALRSLLRPLADRTVEGELRTELQALRALLTQHPIGSGHAPSASDPLPAAHGLAQPSRGAVVALVGPTGAGKTTTIAKLAARAALVERRRVALVSLDTFRVGGEEQIRTFADLIGVPLTMVDETAALADQVAALRGDFERIYVDTPGRSRRDDGALDELAAALQAAGDVEVHLTLPAGASPRAIDGWAARYAGASRLAFTKIDEADELSELVRAPARLGIPVSHLTNGQRVPEDLEDASDARLDELARCGFAVAEVAA